MCAAWTFLQVPGAFDGTLGPVIRLANSDAMAGGSDVAAPDIAVTNVDRARKTDRLQLAQRSETPRRTVARIEIGQSKAVVFRDAEGVVLFGTDPGARVTTIAKNVVVPEITLQGVPAQAGPPPVSPTATSIIPSPAPPVTIGLPSRDTTPTPPLDKAKQLDTAKRPAGCDPSFSPIAAPHLGHILGRCITSIAVPIKLAAAE